MNAQTHRLPNILLVLAVVAGTPVLAQQAPDAGQTLNGLQPEPVAPAAVSTGSQLQIPSIQSPVVASGGLRFEVKGFVFEGNTQIASGQINQRLRAGLASTGTGMDDWLPAQMDLAGLYRVVSWVTLVYQEAGYPFAQAYIPAQKLENGQVRIVIVEGRYDQATVQGADPDWRDQGQRWLAKLNPGNVIRTDELERVALLLGDLPGVTATLSLEPGQSPGTAAVAAELVRENPYDVKVSLTNHGSRYTGEWQLRAQANLNSLFVLGDQIALTALHTDHKMSLGGVKYSVPLGYQGLRAWAEYSENTYELTKGFEGTSGNARVSSFGMSYPLIRSHVSNLSFSAGLNDRKLFNSFSSGASTESYSTISVPLTLNFDHRDQLGQGGLTYGSLTWTNGDLKKVDAIRQGAYQKWSLDVVRIQSFSPQLSLYGRVNMQQANKNLDSSEGMGLGGHNGVRAYPTGEAYGDEAWLAQIEVRYALGAFVPYAFYDHGRTKVNANPALIVSPSPDQERAGAGFGVRYDGGGWEANAYFAWRTLGGAPTATQGSDPKPRVSLAVSYKF